MDYEGRKFKREELEHELYWEERELEEERKYKSEKAWQEKLRKNREELKKKSENENN